MNDTLTRLARWTSESLEPALLPLTADDEAVLGLLRELGYDLQSTPAAVTALDQPATDLLGGLDELLGALFDETATDEQRNQALSAAATTLTFALAELIAAIEELSSSSTATFPTGMAPEELARRLLSMLVVRQLDRRGDKVASILRLIGVIDTELVDAVPSGPDKIPVARLEPERLIDVFTRPAALAGELYKWGTPDLDTGLAFSRIADVAVAFGRPFRLTAIEPSLATLLGIDEDAAEPVLHIPLLTDPIALHAVLTRAPGTGAQLPGLGLTFELAAAGRTELALSERTRLVIQGSGSLGGGLLVTARPQAPLDVRFDLASAVGAATASGGVSLVMSPRLGEERVQLLNVGGAVLLDAEQASLGVGASIAGATPDVMGEVELKDGLLAIGTGNADGFLAKMLPAGGFRLPLALHVTWSRSRGLQFEGGAGLVIRSAEQRTLGPITITLIEAKVMLATDGLKGRGTVNLMLKIGPVSASVEGIGAKADLAFRHGNLGSLDLALGFKPPAGAGFAIKAGPVTGGGYVFFDPEEEQYAGVLQLAFQSIGITAIGLLTTRLPDPSGPAGATKKGFSLLVIITIDLPPIQLGYGFTLNGVGGLMGINRTMMIEPLRNGVRDGSVNSILFPQDVIARAPQIISQLRTIFPPAEGRYLFGPMVKIGWGPNSILELSAGLVLELMAPIRLVILGRIQAALPDKKETVLNLRLDIVGVVDFDKGEISVDASLVDSRLVVFALTGDMALRVGWGASKIFALAAGGFHPAFQPPPGFPQLRRLGIALADSDNPRLRLDAYMALTANTIQFGAALDAYVRLDTFVGTFSASALLTFDALIQFSPFELQADLSAAIDIARNGVPFLHAALQASLTGPTPWHAIGYAEFDCLGKRRIDFEATVGPPAPPPIQTLLPGEVLTKLAGAFAQADAWAALPPSEANRIVSLADQAPGGAVVVHPLGALSARQRVLPLGISVERFGAAVVDPTSFRLEGFRIGSGALQRAGEELRDDFAPGQFLALTDDQKVARPAFESMRSGGTVRAQASGLPADRPGGMAGQSGYEESIVDVEEDRARSAAPAGGKADELPATALAAVVSGGAAAFAGTRADGAAGFRGPGLRVSVAAERYVVAGADTLTRIGAAPGESSAEAHDRLARGTADPAQVVPAREAA